MNDLPHDLAIRWQDFTNSSGILVPAYGIVRVTGSSGGVMTATRPSGVDGTFAFNGPNEVAAAAATPGLLTTDYPCWALYDSADGTPTAGQYWGPGTDTFKLRRAHLYLSFPVIGDVDTTNTVMRVGPPTKQQTIGGKLDATLNYHSSATLSVWANSGGSGAAGTAVRTADAVSSVTITNGGSGYAWAPEVVFSGGGGSGAAGTAVLTANVVTSVTITSGGSGYTSNPTVTFNAESDTGQNVTVHDQTILSSGGSVAGGKFIVAYYCLMSQRWKLKTAQCA